VKEFEVATSHTSTFCCGLYFNNSSRSFWTFYTHEI